MFSFKWQRCLSIASKTRHHARACAICCALQLTTPELCTYSISRHLLLCKTISAKRSVCTRLLQFHPVTHACDTADSPGYGKNHRRKKEYTIAPSSSALMFWAFRRLALILLSGGVNALNVDTAVVTAMNTYMCKARVWLCSADLCPSTRPAECRNWCFL
jgi:hypothetical protein